MAINNNNDKIIIYCDGGSRGNPGPAAIGVVIKEESEKRKEGREYSKFIGEATNNEAEYQAVIFGLKKVKQLIGKEKAKKEKIEIKADSELIVNQLNAEYKIKEKGLIPFFIEIWNLRQDFGEVNFVHIPREQNKEADRLVNGELNGKNTLY
ncbi:MAG: ribonuclease HI family protein [Patescibacteria group bacterium]